MPSLRGCVQRPLTPPVLTVGHPLLPSAVSVGQGSRNQQEGRSQERPQPNNKEKRDPRHQQQHPSNNGSEQYRKRADKPDQDDKRTEKEVRLVSCDPGDPGQDVEGGVQDVDKKGNDRPKETGDHCKRAHSKLHHRSSPSTPFKRMRSARLANSLITTCVVPTL